MIRSPSSLGKRTGSTSRREAGYAIDESIVKLVERATVANDIDYETASKSIVALLEGVLVLLDDHDPGRAFTADLLEWYEERGVLTV